MVAPNSYLPPESQPWARYIEGLADANGASVREVALVAEGAQSQVLATTNQVGLAQAETAVVIEQMQEDILAAAGEGELANGRVTYSSAAPTIEDGEGKPVDAIWWHHDGSGNIIGQYSWDGAAWNTVALSHQVISSVDLGTATVGQLDGVYIKAKTIQAEKLLVGDFTNYLENGDLTAGSVLIDGWGTIGALWNVVNGTDGGGNARLYTQVDSNAGAEVFNNLLLPVTPGEPLRIAAEHRATSFASTTRFGLWFYGQDGTTPVSSAATVIPSSAISPTWTPLSGDFTVPAGAYFARFYIQRTANGGTHQYASLQFRRMVGGTLITNGAIDGKTITGATLRTAASGARIELDSTNGLRGFDSGGNVLTQLTTGGALTATGATISGLLRSAVSGARFQLSGTELRYITAGGNYGIISPIDASTGVGGLMTISDNAVPGSGSGGDGWTFTAGQGRRNTNEYAYSDGRVVMTNPEYIGGVYESGPVDTRTLRSPRISSPGVSFSAGWAVHGTNPLRTYAAWQQVFFDGMVTNSAVKNFTAGTPQQIATLSADMRPATERTFMVDTGFSTKAARITITPAGAVNFTPEVTLAGAAIGSVRISLSGCSWIGS